jgi:uncharacterized protein (DUF433 family)
MIENMESLIEIVPDVCNGKPVIRGTRITVQTVLEFLAVGDSVEDVLAAYPRLTKDDVQACLRHAVTMMSHHFSIKALA